LFLILAFTACDSDTQSKEKCGDGKAVFPENCDKYDFNGETCETQGYYGGNIKCNSDCTFNFSTCSDYGQCGDNIIQTNFGENCDGNQLGDVTCSQLGHYGGNLSCNNNCQFDESQCQGYCGDNIFQSNYEEECDGQIPEGNSCFNSGYFWGEVSCDESCNLNYDLCYYSYQYGDSEEEHATGIAVDSIGNIYVTGYTNGYLDGNTNNDNSFDIFLSKFTATGTKEWTITTGSSEYDSPLDIITDHEDNIYLAGITWGDLGENIQKGFGDGFLAQISSTGSINWLLTMGSTNFDSANSIILSQDGNILVTGYATGEINGLTPEGKQDTFVAKYSLAGEHLWTRLFGTEENDVAVSIHEDSMGNILVAGTTDGTFINNNNLGKKDIFLLKLTEDGSFVEVNQYGSSENDSPAGMVKDDEDNLYLAGDTTGSLGDENQLGWGDGFIMKINPAGLEAWVHHIGSNLIDNVFDLQINPFSGNLVVTGITSGEIGQYSNQGEKDIFIAVFNNSGTRLYSKMYGTSLKDRGTTAIVLEDESLIIGGASEGNFENQLNQGNFDILLIREHLDQLNSSK
jgi:hypothetical protein